MTLTDFLNEWYAECETVSVRTSGSTGTPKQMDVLKSRMRASARRTCDFLHLSAGDTALLCMPLDYIAGKMMVVRSIERDLQIIETTPSSHPMRDIDSPISFAAMVPLQVMKSLETPQEAKRLMEINHLIIGGGAIDSHLANALRDFPNYVWSTYGMTETLSHIAMRRLNGPEASEWYTPLDGISLRKTEKGTLAITAPDICEGEIVTNDICEIRPDNTFRILGRTDNTINSGGVKVQIEEAEHIISTALEDKGLRDSFRITWLPHPTLGQEVTMVVEATMPQDKIDLLTKAFDALPNKYWHPRRVVALCELPTTGNGKPDRKRTAEMALAKVSNQPL